MFNSIVGNTVLTDDIANTFFNHKIISSEQLTVRNQTEYSLLATCRALFYPRMEESDTMIVGSCSYQGRGLTEDAVRRMVANWDGRSQQDGAYFKVCIVDNGDVQKFSEVFQETEGWEEVDRVRMFFQNSFPACVYVDMSKRTSIMIVELGRSTDTLIRSFHLLQVTVLSANPWFYTIGSNGDDKITEEEMHTFEALSKGDYDTYINFLNNFAKKTGFREVAILKRLEEFETARDQNRIQRFSTDIARTTERIDDLMQSLSELIQDKRDLQLREQALRLGLAAKDGRFAVREYFETHNNMRYISSSSNELIFAIDTYLSDWFDGAKDNAIHNRRSVMYDNVPREYHDIAEKLYTKVFDTKEIRIAMTGVFGLGSGGYLVARAGFDRDIPNDSMPNPHLNNFSCLGGYESDIVAAMEKEDWAYALEIASIAAGNINFEDSTVMHAFSEYMFTKECDLRNCFELPNGKRVTLKEALKYITESEVENEQTDQNE